MVILLFRDSPFWLDLKVGTFLSFCLPFTKFDVGISPGELDCTAPEVVAASVILICVHRLLILITELAPRFSGFLFSFLVV